MKLKVYENRKSMAEAAAAHAAAVLRGTLAEQGAARIVAATGASQFEFLDALTAAPGIDWSRVEMFHLDEYVGLPLDHPASFRKYLLDRLIHKAGITRYHLLDGEQDPVAVCRDAGRELTREPVDVAFVGIGENGHLAFNDPPADFETEEPYIVVELDEACRRQQLGEGWFDTLEAVPRTAITMSIRQILKAREIICTVPDERKARAVRACLAEGPPGPDRPASALLEHPNVTVYLDRASASLLPAT